MLVGVLNEGDRIVIVGAGDFGRELYYWTRQSHPGVTIDGFIDDNLQAASQYNLGPAVIAKISGYQPVPGTKYLMGISDPNIKLKIAKELKSKGAEFASYVHPTALISGAVTLGEGVVLCPYSVVSCNATVGDLSAVNLHCSVGHDVKMGAGCTLSSHVDLCGHVQVGDGVFFGSHASVLPKVSVESFSRIGAGAIVLTKVKEGTIVFGVPAKKF